MKKKKSLAAFVLTVVAAMILAACGNSAGQDKGAGPDAGKDNAAPADSVKITLLNSKSEIQQQLTEAAAEFSKANPGITVEVMTTAGTQSPVERASSLYAAGTPATLNMLDAGDIARFQDKAADLSGEKWVGDLAQPNQIDGKTLAFPFAVEGYGLIYNKETLERAVGGDFDPSTINTASALEQLFQKIEAAGIAPIIIGSMDWSLGNHFLALAYAAQPGNDVPGTLDQLKAGELKLADNAVYNGLLDTFDIMKKYNQGKNDPLSITYEQSVAAVANGQAAITFNGNWLITELQKVNPDAEFGFIPVPVSNQPEDRANTALAIGATKQIFIDKEKSTEAQQAAAKKFLDWLVYDPAGQDFLVNKANVIPAFKNITLEPSNSLAQEIVAYSNAGRAIPFAGNYVPGDHWKVLGASMQKYLANKTDRAGLAADIEAYWKNIK